MKALEDDVHAALGMLRRHINPLQSPIYRLPPDVFPEIASHLTNETDLVNATHVSYHVRNTLLSHPSLWSHLNFDRERRARAFLERSGQTPLHIDMPKNSIRTTDSLAKLRGQSERIASLNLQHWRIQKKFLSESLPSLRRLEVPHHHYGYYWDESPDNPWGSVLYPVIEPTLWSLPSLTSLIVNDLDPALLHTPHLTRFKFFSGKYATSPSVLPSFLNSCPLLEHIDISYEGEFPRDQDLVVSLPNLRTYTETIYDRVYPITLLNMLSLPPLCSVTLRSKSSETKGEVDVVLPHFENPDYLAQIKRIKLRTTYGYSRNEVAETLELVNAKGTKVCFERNFEGGVQWPLVQGDKKRTGSMVHPGFSRRVHGQSLEVLCIDGCTRPNTETGFFFLRAWVVGNVRTLILSGGAVRVCLSVLSRELGNRGRMRCPPPIHTLIIHTDQSDLKELLSAAQEGKVAGFPFKYVSLFLQGDLGWEYRAIVEEDLDKLRKCVERLEVAEEDDALDWDVDKYFLDGLDHLQKNRDVQWD